VTVASQRLTSYRKEHLSDMRVADMELFHAHAMYWVFTPALDEKRMWDRLHRVHAHNTRQLPLGAYDYTSSWWGWWLPEFAQRSMGIAPFVGPDFH